VVEKLSSLSNRENASVVISKDDYDKLSWDNKHVLVLDFLNLGLTLPAYVYCGTVSVQWPFFCRWPQLLCQIIVPLCENARRHTPNWTAVHFFKKGVKTGVRVYQEDVLQGVVTPLNTTIFNGQQ